MASRFCPACGSTDLTADPSGASLCRACGQVFRVNVRHCAGCGGQLDPGLDSCPACGLPADLAEQVLGQRAGAASPLWLERSRSQAGALKAAGEETSQVRMQGLVDIDRRREEETARQVAARKASDRRMMAVMAVAGAIFLVVVITAVFIALLR